MTTSKDSDESSVPTGVDPDRPYVDGSASSPAEIRAEIEELRDGQRQDVDALREEVGETLDELAGRFDVPARTRATRDEVVTWIQERRVAIMGGTAALLVAVLIRRRSRSRGTIER